MGLTIFIVFKHTQKIFRHKTDRNQTRTLLIDHYVMRHVHLLHKPDNYMTLNIVKQF